MVLTKWFDVFQFSMPHCKAARANLLLRPPLTPTDFFPTYKKYCNRGPTNYCTPTWVKDTYHLHFREPIYKVARLFGLALRIPLFKKKKKKKKKR